MTRTWGSSSRARHASANSSRMVLFMALSCSGRLLMSQPTGPWRSTRRHWYVASGIGLPAGEARITLLAEGGHPLSEVVGPGAELHREAFVRELLVEVGVGARADQPFGEADGHGRGRGE